MCDARQGDPPYRAVGKGHREWSGGRLAALVLAAVGSLALIGSTRPADLGSYAPRHSVTGTIRVWGAPIDAPMIEQLEASFGLIQTGVRFETTLHGPESTFGAVNMGVADIAFMSREVRVPLETMAFEWWHHYPPFVVTIANAGIGVDRIGYDEQVNLAFIVNVRNPLTCLTLAQARDLFSGDKGTSAGGRPRWGALLSKPDWRDRPVHVYGPPVDSMAAIFIRDSVLAGSRKWASGYRIVRGDWRALASAVARDPDAIGFAPPIPENSRVKPLRLARTSSSPCFALDRNSVHDLTYPLLRTIDVVLDRTPNAALAPQLKEFLRFILSRDGQSIIDRVGAYLPLEEHEAAEQRRRLQ